MEHNQMSGRSVQTGVQERYEQRYGRVIHLDVKGQVVWLDMEFNSQTVCIKFEEVLHSSHMDPRTLREGEFLKLLIRENNIRYIERAELIPINATFLRLVDENTALLQYGVNKTSVPIGWIQHNKYINSTSKFILWKSQENFKFAEVILETSPQPDLTYIAYQGPNQASSSTNLSSHSHSHQYPDLPPIPSSSPAIIPRDSSSTPGYTQPNYPPTPGYEPELDSPYYQSIKHKDYLQYKLNEKILTCGKERLPLDVLRDSYTDSKIRQRLERLKEEFDSFRKSRGDGNCYYRAVGVSYLEHLCRFQNYAPFLHDFIQSLCNNSGYFTVRHFNMQNRGYLVSALISLYNDASKTHTMLKLEELLQDPEFDMAIIAEMRCITANYLEINKDSDDIAPFLFDGIENKLREILTYGNEAEGIEFSCLARGLGVFIKHISMVDDHSYDVYGPENVECAPLLHVLYKGGHYDMIYTKTMTAIDGYDLINSGYGKAPDIINQEMANKLFIIKNRPEQVEEAKEEIQFKSQEASLNTSLYYNPEPQHSAPQYSHYQSHHESSLTGSNIHQSSSEFQYDTHQQYIQVPQQYFSYQESPHDQEANKYLGIQHSHMPVNASSLHQNIADPMPHQKIFNPYEVTPALDDSYIKAQGNPVPREIEMPTPGGIPDNKDYSIGQYASSRPPHNPIQAYKEEVKNSDSRPQDMIPNPESLSRNASQRGLDSLEISCGCRVSLEDLKNQLSKLVYSLPDQVYISKYLCKTCYQAIDIRSHSFIIEQIQQLKYSKPSRDQIQASLKHRIPCIYCDLNDIPLNRHRDFPDICLRCLLLLIRDQIIDFTHQYKEYRDEIIVSIQDSFSTCGYCKGIYKLKDVIDQERLQFMKMRPRCEGCKNIYKCDHCGDSFDGERLANDSKHFLCRKCVDELRRHR